MDKEKLLSKGYVNPKVHQAASSEAKQGGSQFVQVAMLAACHRTLVSHYVPQC